MHHRVFITGLGIISAIGNGTEETLASIRKLKTGIGLLTNLDSIHAEIPVAEVKHSSAALAELIGFDTSPDTTTRNTLLALVAARQTLESSQWNKHPDIRSGLVMATTVGGMDFNERYYKSLLASEEHKDIIGLLDSADCTEKVAAFAGIRHGVSTVSTACSSSANAIMIGARYIRNNRFDRMLVGGTDSLTRFTLNGFLALEILSPTGCRPFDQNRNGLTIGEGAAFLVLESEAVADPSRIIGELTGYANANEAFHQTASSSDGAGALMAMKGALASARLSAGDISYINAHGTGTEINDLSEGRAISALFQPHIPPVSSTKGFTGHTLGAAGAIEAVLSVLALQHQIVLPAINFEKPMEELRFRPADRVLQQNITHVMSNSFGFGGNNTTLIFSDTR